LSTAVSEKSDRERGEYPPRERSASWRCHPWGDDPHKDDTVPLREKAHLCAECAAVCLSPLAPAACQVPHRPRVTETIADAWGRRRLSRRSYMTRRVGTRWQHRCASRDNVLILTGGSPDPPGGGKTRKGGGLASTPSAGPSSRAVTRAGPPQDSDVRLVARRSTRPRRAVTGAPRGRRTRQRPVCVRLADR